MPAPVLQFKRGVVANLPGLRAGEPGFATDSYDLYVGLTSATSTNKIVGSGRFWTNNTATTGSGVNLVEGTDNGEQFLTLKSPDTLSGISTYVMPASGSANQILTVSSVSNGVHTLAFSDPASSSFTLAADSGSNDTFNTGETLTFSGGEGIDTTVSDNAITIAAEDASDSNKGVASFDSGDFGVSSGDVTLSDAVVKSVTTDSGALTPSSHGFSVLGGEGMNVTHTGTTVTVAGEDATSSNKGIASFDSDDFDVSSGAVTLGDSANGAVLAISATANETTVSRSNGTVTIGLPDDVTVGGGLTATTFTLAGVAVTAILDEDDLTSNRADALATQQSIKAYVDAVDTTLGIDADSGGASTVATSQTLTVSGTSNEVETSVSGQTITIGLPNTVNVTTAIDVPTIEATNLKARDGTAAITITNSTGAVSIANSMTISGDLFVNGTTTEVNTSTLSVEDTLVELGKVDGAVPASDVNKDLGLVFHYYSGSAKKAAVYWDDSTSRIVVASEVSESSGVLTNNTSGSLEVGALYLNDCAGTSQVISCSGTTRSLENITIDAGSF